MAQTFSNDEKTDMLECYFKSNRNSQLASDMYLELYPERQQPHRTIFGRIVNNLRNNGCFEKKRGLYHTDSVERGNIIQEAVNNNPRISVRKAEQETRVPKSSVHRILHAKKFHPYKPIIVQKLNENDYPRRLEFCRWYLQKCREDEAFALD